MTDIQIFPNEYLNQKFLFIPAPQQNFHSGFQRVIHTIEFLTAAIQKNCGGPFESNILLCVTSHFFPLRNHNFFTHLIVFLTGNQLCLSFWLGRNLVFQVTCLNPGDKIFMRGLDGAFTSQSTAFLSICQHARSVSRSVGGKIMAAVVPPAYCMLSAPDLLGRSPQHSDSGHSPTLQDPVTKTLPSEKQCWWQPCKGLLPNAIFQTFSLCWKHLDYAEEKKNCSFFKM